MLYKNKATKIQNEVLKNNQNGQLFELEQKYQTVKKERTIAEQKNKLAQNKLYFDYFDHHYFSDNFVNFSLFYEKKEKGNDRK